MEELRAHVRDGQIVLDQPTELPEGAVLRIIRIDEGDMDDAERADLENAIEAGAMDFDNGDYLDARDFARELVLRR